METLQPLNSGALYNFFLLFTFVSEMPLKCPNVKIKHLCLSYSQEFNKHSILRTMVLAE